MFAARWGASYACRMAEIRKHDPKVSLIGELVRAAAGEPLRPVEPGQAPGAAPAQPAATADANIVSAAGGPVIGMLPNAVSSWVVMSPGAASGSGEQEAASGSGEQETASGSGEQQG